MEDKKIIDMYWERNEEAIAQTQMKYGGYCHSIAYNILSSHEDAEECVNDTLNSAWDAIPPQKPSKLQYFLGRITRNIAIDRYRFDRAKKRTVEMASIVDEYWECIPNGDAPIEDEVVLKTAINSFLSSLDARTRVIFMRRYWYAMSVKSIAIGLRMTEGHVHVILHRTRNKFKEHLQKEGIFE